MQDWLVTYYGYDCYCFSVWILVIDVVRMMELETGMAMLIVMALVMVAVSIRGKK